VFAFNRRYFALAALLFCTELLIALYAHDDFVRPYLGDVLVVILIYCFIKTFFKLSVNATAVVVLAVAFSIEFLQFVKIVEILGLRRNSAASIAIGTSFAWEDLLCYIAGIIIVIGLERCFAKAD